jgi:WhiB family transcriptional regulator, redox-sensing transcriptional regulator
MIATVDAVEWREAGACLGADPDLFFPISQTGLALEQIVRAKAVCARCPVRLECLRFALETRETNGIWGGTTPEERRRELRRRARQATRKLRRASLPEPGRPAVSLHGARVAAHA